MGRRTRIGYHGHCVSTFCAYQCIISPNLHRNLVILSGQERKLRHNEVE